ncbi:MAG: hypothetical protein ACJA0I_001012, partial [Gammaproteobacteria bacterium]
CSTSKFTAAAGRGWNLEARHGIGDKNMTARKTAFRALSSL